MVVRPETQTTAFLLPGTTACSEGTGRTDLLGENGLLAVLARRDNWSRVPTRTPHQFGLKIDLEVSVGEAILELRLWRDGGANWADQIFAQWTAVLDIFAADVA